MKRREFLSTAAAASAAWWVPRTSCGSVHGACVNGSQPQPACVTAGFAARRVLLLIELAGGNDGLNTVIPFADPLYRRLRPQLALPRDALLQLDERIALHPALLPWLPIWQSGELAIVQGLGHERASQSHFRAAEIWHTASDPRRYLRDGWLSRALTPDAGAAGFVADGAEPGPLGGWPRATLLASAYQPSAQQLAFFQSSAAARMAALTFPAHRFGASIRAALASIAAAPIAPTLASADAERVVVKLTLSGFDTHACQSARHAALLAQLASGCAALRAALLELGWWRDALIVTYSEFGRDARENDAGGTGHGGSAPHFVMGGRVRGGLYGSPPALSNLDSNGVLPVGIDFRRLYATLLGPWWHVDPGVVLEGHFEPLPLLRL
ncbi:MAG TPA: DUF1501 domain-containing protein [Paraburkholderia sp.]|nr:DUF1501 domain-containing protein [Paraburkholderia sp.]